MEVTVETTAEKVDLNGVALIKPEYVYQREITEPEVKKIKTDHPKQKGQFKHRYKQNNAYIQGEKICYSLIDVSENGEAPRCENSDCKFNHDVAKFLSTKPADIGDECPVFKLKGHCPWGIACRFGKSHTTEDGKNVTCDSVVEDFEKHGEKTINSMSKDVTTRLRKKNYDFSKSHKVLKLLPNCKIHGEKEGDEGEDKTGPCLDVDVIKLREDEKKTINWHGKLYLSPLTTLGNVPFRRICKEYGADITCGEMAMATSLLSTLRTEVALVKRHETEDLFGVQLCGNNPYAMTQCAQLLEETIAVDFIDINLGCPIDAVYQKGGGSGLLRREKVLESVVKSMARVMTIPLTVKTRTGVFAGKNIAHRLMPLYTVAGVSMVTVHGRSREQRYTRTPDWKYIEECAQAAAPTPVFGNGDILSHQDYNRALAECPTVAGVMIGRGALYKPWIFKEIKEQQDWDISSNERLDILKKFVRNGLEHWGSDTRGVETTRKFLLEWLSFLYRYIPLGLLQRPPQRINERPERYFGRNDLETLMASPNCADWVKISEMLLGPVPETFHFLPKHKANSWS